MRKRTLRTVLALLLGVIGVGQLNTNPSTVAAARPAHASNCGYFLGGSDNMTRGYCYNVQTFGVDHWQAYQNCTNGGIQYGQVVYQPAVISTTPRCYGTVITYGVVHN